MAKKLIYSRTEAEQTQAWELGDETQYPDLPTEPEYAADGCPVCGDPLSWHEQACHPRPTASPATPEASAAAKPQDSFTYAVGALVLADEQAEPCPVVWRGQLKERDPQTNLLRRVPVYRLGDGFWDCYREEELRVA